MANAHSMNFPDVFVEFDKLRLENDECLVICDFNRSDLQAYFTLDKLTGSFGIVIDTEGPAIYADMGPEHVEMIYQALHELRLKKNIDALNLES